MSCDADTDPEITQGLAAGDYLTLIKAIRRWANELGFQQTGIAPVQLDRAEAHLQQWLKKHFHGEMNYMQRHGMKRSQPAALEPGTLSVISVRMDYLPEAQEAAAALLQQPDKAYISRYALGRDYHKIIRRKLQQLAERINRQVSHFSYRVYCDSAPVLEKPIAELAGLGWMGKHTNILHREHGSWFFLGEIYTNLPLPADLSQENHCGTCEACIEICPTRAIVEPYVLDARLCISYLTIEYKGSIPVELRPLLGNRIYGCDDCQLVCPWNRFARLGVNSDFQARHDLDQASLIELFNWSEEEFLKKTEGSAIRRIGYHQWLRNIAVALGNASKSSAAKQVLERKTHHSDPLVAEHAQWALDQQSVGK